MTDQVKVTPLDIQQKKFQIVFRGYDKSEVDMFLDLVRDEMESLVREIAELRDFRMGYDDRVRELNEREETVKNTMIMTQKLSEESKEHSRKEAALMIQESELKGQEIIMKAKQEKVRLEAEIQELSRRRHHFLEDIKKVVQMHLEMVRYEEGASDTRNEATEK
ncbi:MAG: DivIVA domain-containing protein [Nitrospirota bacterium]